MIVAYTGVKDLYAKDPNPFSGSVLECGIFWSNQHIFSRQTRVNLKILSLVTQSFIFVHEVSSRYLLNKRGKYISVFKRKCNVNWVKFCFGSRSESNGEVISGSESNCCGSATLAYRYQYMSTEIATGRYLIRHTGAGTGTGTWYIAHNVELACCCWS